MIDLRPELGFSGQIWAILLGIGPLCLDLGHFAWISAILIGFELFGRIRVRIGPEEDKALRKWGWGRGGRTDGRADGRTDSPCVLQDFVLFGAAAQKGVEARACYPLISKNAHFSMGLQTDYGDVSTHFYAISKQMKLKLELLDRSQTKNLFKSFLII